MLWAGQLFLVAATSSSLITMMNDAQNTKIYLFPQRGHGQKRCPPVMNKWVVPCPQTTKKLTGLKAHGARETTVLQHVFDQHGVAKLNATCTTSSDPGEMIQLQMSLSFIFPRTTTDLSRLGVLPAQWLFRLYSFRGPL